RAQAYNEFLNAQPLSANKFPRHNPFSKPTDLSNEPGLVAAYNMIPSNGTLVDISGNGNNGTITGPISSVDGLVFDGIDDDITLASALSLGTSYTIALRFKPNVSTNDVILGDQSSSDNILYIAATSFRVAYRINSTTYYFDNNSYFDGEINNIVVTRDGTSLKCYTNGVDVGTIALDGGDNICS
ncbi:MAG: LamG-like jellyroll fold domain-containing protein, partial [Promethearchaeota archaeon]